MRGYHICNNNEYEATVRYDCLARGRLVRTLVFTRYALFLRREQASIAMAPIPAATNPMEAGSGVSYAV